MFSICCCLYNAKFSTIFDTSLDKHTTIIMLPSPEPVWLCVYEDVVSVSFERVSPLSALTYSNFRNCGGICVCEAATSCSAHGTDSGRVSIVKEGCETLKSRMRSQLREGVRTYFELGKGCGDRYAYLVLLQLMDQQKIDRSHSAPCAATSCRMRCGDTFCTDYCIYSAIVEIAAQ